MDQFRRYAVYVMAQGALAEAGAHWLGWDAVAGRAAEQPAPEGLDMAAITATPRRYGFHGTIKPPFALAPVSSPGRLLADLRALCTQLAPVTLPGGLVPDRLGSFLALVPAAPSPALGALAADVVRRLDAHRAPLSPAERARRNPAALTPAQRTNLDHWGYPFVLDQFRFHMTLTGSLTADQAARAEPALAAHLGEAARALTRIDALSLMGEDEGGRFHQIARLPLTGQGAAPL